VKQSTLFSARGDRGTIVVDVSLRLDLFNKRDRLRLELAESFFAKVESLEIYEPTLFKVELASLLSRYNPRSIVEKLVEEIMARIRLCRDLDEDAYRVALATGCRCILHSVCIENQLRAIL